VLPHTASPLSTKNIPYTAYLRLREFYHGEKRAGWGGRNKAENERGRGKSGADKNLRPKENEIRYNENQRL